MESKKQQWDRIKSDEVAAIAIQQGTAGGTHSPVLGPGPYGDHATNASVAEAVAAERERCAMMATTWSADQPEHVRDLLLRLAEAIRQTRPV